MGYKGVHHELICGIERVLMSLDIQSIDSLVLIQPSISKLSVIVVLLFGAEFSDINFLESLDEVLCLIWGDEVIHKILRSHLNLGLSINFVI